MRDEPWLSIIAGATIMVTVLGFNLLGDGLRDALDPRHLSRTAVGRKNRAKAPNGANGTDDQASKTMKGIP
jgi:hypothetical protein